MHLDYSVTPCLNLLRLTNKIPQWLQEQNLISHHSGGWKSEMWVPVWWRSGEGPLAGLWKATSSVSSRAGGCCGVSSHQGTDGVTCAPSSRPHLNPVTFPKPHLPIASHWSLRPHRNLGRKQFSP